MDLFLIIYELITALCTEIALWDQKILVAAVEREIQNINEAKIFVILSIFI